MASGSFGATTDNAYISGTLSWSSVPNTEGNYSDVTAELRLSRTNSYTTYGTGTWYLDINGTQNSRSAAVSISLDSNTYIISNTVRVYHTDDGSKQISISVTGGIPGTSYTATYCSGTVSLDTIPRASTITTFNNFTIGDNIPVVLNRKSGSFTQDIHLYVGSTFVCARTNVADNYTLVLTSGEQDIIYNATPNGTYIGVVLYCLTYSGGVQVGSTQNKVANASVGVSIIPDFTTITSAETITAVSTNVGLFVQNLSRILCTITGAAGIKGSTISSYQLSIDGVIYNSSSATSGAINKSGDITVSGTITDSRGRTKTKNVTVNLLAYSVPSIAGFNVTRANSDGSDNPMGTYAKVASSGSAQSLINSVEKNTLTYKIYSRVRGTSDWGAAKKTETISGLTLSVSDDLFSGYTATSSYDFRLDILDKFNTALSVDVLPTGQVTMSWGNNGVGVGKVHEQGGLDVSGAVYEDGERLKQWEPGDIKITALVNASSGWLLCNGAAVSRTTYDALFAAISTTYGAGDGSTTFNVPNLKGRVPVGLDSGQTEFDSLGETGGAKTHTLASAEMPIHTHTQDAHVHEQNVSANPSSGGNGIRQDYDADVVGASAYTQGINTQSATATNQNSGSGGAHNNLQPYITLNFIIKY